MFESQLIFCLSDSFCLFVFVYKIQETSELLNYCIERREKPGFVFLSK